MAVSSAVVAGGGEPRAKLPPPTRADPSSFVGGVPLGGIGAGTVELRGDGSFRAWQIFNNWGNAETVGLFKYLPSYDLLNAFAAFRVDDKAYVLETDPPLGLPGVTAIDYTGWFPFADLTYNLGPECPVQISLQGFGSYVPHRLDDSSIPAIGLCWRLKNTSTKPVRVRLALSAVNPVGEECREEMSGKLHVVQSTRGRDGLALAALDGEAMSVAGGADTAEALNTFWSAFTSPHPLFEANGKGARIAQVLMFTLQPGEEKRERFAIGWFFPNHYENGEGPLVGHHYELQTTSPVESVNLLATRFDALQSDSARWRDTLRDSSWPQWVNHWLVNNQYTIAKFTWWTKDGRFMTYESPECANGSPVHITDLANWPVLDEFPQLDLRLLRQFAENQGKDGRIPEEFNNDHLDHGGARPSITFPGGRDLTDVNPKYVVEIYHRWRETGDEDFLAATWPSVKRAILYARKFDAMGVGLPSGPDLSSTWDHWTNRYLFSYSGTVWLAGLRAAEELARHEGDAAFAEQMHAMFERGLATMNAHLWNGDFYAMAADKDLKQDDLSFVEGTYGDAFSRFIGLGGVLPDDRSLSTLRAVARLNNHPTRWGLVVSANKAGEMVEYLGDKRAQITVCHAIPAPIALIQQGDEDDIANGLRILKQMYDLGEKHPGGLWNLPHHVVAATGERNVDDFGHYMRDRCLWALLKVLNGWRYDAAAQSLGIGPVLNPERSRGPWICSAAYGTLAQEISGKRQTVLLSASEGALHLKELDCRSRTGTAAAVVVTEDRMPLKTTFVQKGNVVHITFAEPMKLAAGSSLKIVLEGDHPLPSRP